MSSKNMPHGGDGEEGGDGGTGGDGGDEGDEGDGRNEEGGRKGRGEGNAGGEGSKGDADALNLVHLYAAVVDMHKKGIAHGDLAPRNVVVQDGRVKLIDFGEAYPHECKREGEYGELEALREMLGMGV
ncbi:hypothetical protein JCM10049v2_006986 [Rhodotorula toruloides]